MEQVLMFNIEKKKSVNIKMLCHKLNIGFKEIDKESYGKKLEAILGLFDDGTNAENSGFDGEMIFLVGFSNERLNRLLDQMRRKKAVVELKAILTDTNRSYTPCELYHELEAERAAIQNGTTVHQA